MTEKTVSHALAAGTLEPRTRMDSMRTVPSLVLTIGLWGVCYVAAGAEKDRFE